MSGTAGSLGGAGEKIRRTRALADGPDSFVAEGSAGAARRLAAAGALVPTMEQAAMGPCRDDTPRRTSIARCVFNSVCRLFQHAGLANGGTAAKRWFGSFLRCRLVQPVRG